MGQRLVITVRSLGKDIAKIYYHWSAYSISALEEAKDVVDCICACDDPSEKALQLRLIHFCEERGGGIDGTGYEFSYIQRMFPNETFKRDNYSRNNGLIAISEEGMNDLERWSEGDVCIDLDDDTIYNEVLYQYDNIEEYNDDNSEWREEEMELDDIPVIPYDLTEIPFDQINDVIASLGNVNGFVCRHNSTIYRLIA